MIEELFEGYLMVVLLGFSFVFEVVKGFFMVLILVCEEEILGWSIVNSFGVLYFWFYYLDDIIGI